MAPELYSDDVQKGPIILVEIFLLFLNCILLLFILVTVYSIKIAILNILKHLN